MYIDFFNIFVHLVKKKLPSFIRMLIDNLKKIFLIKRLLESGFSATAMQQIK